jgi:hypothetical protein
MQWWKKRLSVLGMIGLLAGCNAWRDQAPGSLVVREAHIAAAADGAQLVLDLELALNGPMSDALEHGIPITLQVELRGAGDQLQLSDRRQIEMRYFPLSRRYQLRDSMTGNVRSFSASGYLTDALAALHLPLPTNFAHLPIGTRLKLAVALDHSALPGALRLPAFLEPAWRLKAPEFEWIVAAG